MTDGEPKYTPEELQQLEGVQQEMEDEQRENISDDQRDEQFEFQEGYGDFPQEEKHSRDAFLNKAAFATKDTLRVTNLDKDELGKPIFNVRFLLDMEDIAKFYLDDLCGKFKIKINKIAQYFRDKVNNIADSGMSKEGFTMLANTTRNINIARTRKKERIENLRDSKGGARRG